MKNKDGELESYNILIHPAGVRKGFEDIGYDDELIDVSGQDVNDVLDNSDVGDVIVLKTNNFENTHSRHDTENVLKVGKNEYMTYNHSPGASIKIYDNVRADPFMDGGSDVFYSHREYLKNDSILIEAVFKHPYMTGSSSFDEFHFQKSLRKLFV